MDFLARIWEILGLLFGGILKVFERGMTGMFGSSNARFISCTVTSSGLPLSTGVGSMPQKTS